MKECDSERQTSQACTYIPHQYSPLSEMRVCLCVCICIHHVTLLDKVLHISYKGFFKTLLFKSSSPSISTKQVNFGFAKALVNMSAMLLPVSMYFKLIFLSSTASLMKWYLRSICFIHKWNLLSLARSSDPWLSPETVSDLISPPMILLTNVCSYIASFPACMSATYSDSVLDKAICTISA